ncbi:MAG: ABC transporter permease [Planctomycetota bacterium]
MPIHDVGYRRWDGRLSSVWLRWTVVAGAGIRLVWKSHWLRRMLIFAWLPTAVTGLGFFVYEQALEHQQWKRAAVQVMDWHLASGPAAPSSDFPIDSKAGMADLRDRFARRPEDVRHEVWSLLLMAFFRYPQGLLMVLIVGIIAPSLISLDMRSRAFLLYFSRPITPVEYICGKALVIWTYLAAVTTLPALVLYVLGLLLSPSLEVVFYTWDLPLRILLASLVLMLPTTSLAMLFSSLTTESRYAGFAWFALWGLGWTAYANLRVLGQSRQWSMLSLYHMLGRVQEWVFGLSTDMNEVSSAALLLIILTVMPLMVLTTRVVAPMRV